MTENAEKEKNYYLHRLSTFPPNLLQILSSLLQPPGSHRFSKTPSTQHSKQWLPTCFFSSTIDNQTTTSSSRTCPPSLSHQTRPPSTKATKIRAGSCCQSWPRNLIPMTVSRDSMFMNTLIYLSIERGRLTHSFQRLSVWLER